MCRAKRPGPTPRRPPRQNRGEQMTSPQDAQMRARVLATALVARAIVMLEREIAQNTTGVLEADDLAANFERLGVRELDVPYIFARLGGNPIDPIVELV